ncbi:MAG: prenyltransferase [Candidatus Omnitrophica bacterium]|nr:prenyltransferase [Candidatus Omnitrophota bacterium]
MGKANKLIVDIPRALRLSFLSVSIIPFVFGSLIQKGGFNFLGFFFGILCVVCTHLSANLINDYADSRSGADWQDKNFYKFFGGSKLVQEGVFSEGFYLRLAILFAILSVLFATLIAFNTGNFSVVELHLIVVALSWSYTQKPLQFSYHKAGEILIFLFFGPILVTGGYFIQTGIFPDFKSFTLSLPFGFLTTAILFANEVPDYFTDQKTGKNTAVSLTGIERAFLLYAALIACAFLTVGIAVKLKYIHPIALASFLLAVVAYRAAYILKRYYNDKLKLITASKMTILIHGLTGIILIASAAIK